MVNGVQSVYHYNTSGTKFVIKKVNGVRKQLLIMSGTPILAFVTNGEDYIFLKERICSIFCIVNFISAILCCELDLVLCHYLVIHFQLKRFSY